MGVSFTTLSALDDVKFSKFVYLHREDTVIKPKVLLHNISESAFALYDDNGKENEQTMNLILITEILLNLVVFLNFLSKF